MNRTRPTSLSVVTRIQQEVISSDDGSIDAGNGNDLVICANSIGSFEKFEPPKSPTVMIQGASSSECVPNSRNLSSNTVHTSMEVGVRRSVTPDTSNPEIPPAGTVPIQVPLETRVRSKLKFETKKPLKKKSSLHEWANYTKGFMRNTTIHGVSHITDSYFADRTSLAIIWAIWTVACTGILIACVKLRADQLIENNIVTAIQWSEPKNLSFPKISICNENGYDMSSTSYFSVMLAEEIFEKLTKIDLFSDQVLGFKLLIIEFLATRVFMTSHYIKIFGNDFGFNQKLHKKHMPFSTLVKVPVIPN